MTSCSQAQRLHVHGKSIADEYIPNFKLCGDLWFHVSHAVLKLEML